METQKTIHLALKTALPLPTKEQPYSRSPRRGLLRRPALSIHKKAILERTAQTVRQAADYCVRCFKVHEQCLWWDAPIKDEGTVRRISGGMKVIYKLREIAPLNGFQLPSAIKDGIHAKVSDLLLSYAKRKLDPHFADKTSWPEIGDNFPIVWQMGFTFFEHQNTGKFYVYLPLFPRGGHRENLSSHIDSSGSQLRVFGTNEVQKLKAKGGLILPLEFDKWGEATFIRDQSHPPGWKARHRRYDKRWLAELRNPKTFRPKRLEMLVSTEGQIKLNIACEVDTRPTIQVENFMGVALGLHDLLTIVVIDGKSGKVIYHRNVSADKYEQTYFRRLQGFRQSGKPFRQELDTLHFREVAKITAEAVQFKAAITVETVGSIPKGKYAPRMNLRLSYWPFGKLQNIINYKAQHQGLPKPYGVYSGTVRLLCHKCGATNKGSEKLIAMEGPMVFCGKCETHQNSGLNTALNLARRCRELYNAKVQVM